jgi:hypothetical protein
VKYFERIAMSPVSWLLVMIAITVAAAWSEQ